MGLLWAYLFYAIVSYILKKVTSERFSLGVRMTIVTLILVLFGTDAAGAGLGWLMWLFDCIMDF